MSSPPPPSLLQMGGSPSSIVRPGRLYIPTNIDDGIYLAIIVKLKCCSDHIKKNHTNRSKRFKIFVPFQTVFLKQNMGSYTQAVRKQTMQRNVFYQFIPNGICLCHWRHLVKALHSQAKYYSFTCSQCTIRVQPHSDPTPSHSFLCSDTTQLYYLNMLKMWWVFFLATLAH